LKFDFSFFQVLLAWFIVLIVPGQDMALIIRTTVTRGAQQSFRLVFGVCAALLIHIAVATSTLGFLFSQSPFVFSFVQKAGALYLGYLGFTFILSSRKEQSAIWAVGENVIANERSHFEMAGIGFLSTILNPKVTTFFFGLFGSFMAQEVSIFNSLCYAGGIISMTLVYYKIFIFLLAKNRSLRFLQRNTNRVELISGSILCAISIRLFFL
jgi:threonine/homoserine/homoserine lactone efflux protein